MFMTALKRGKLVADVNISNDCFAFTSSIEEAQKQAELDLITIEETIQSIHIIKPECDKVDYTLAACSGVLCGLLDIFLVGKPKESPLGDITDEWFAERTKDFAKRCGWDEKGDKPLSSAIRFLEKKFKIPYDQRGMGDAASFIFDLNAKNHHFKSLAHNPTLCGLFFSVLDQFANESHFVSGGELISLVEADGSFELQGHDVPSKLFCAITNWFGHLLSDMSGSSGSQGRGMGIPSPIWAWTNSVLAIKKSLKIPVNQFDRSVNELALQMYNEGYDARFQTAQAIPVFINEMLVRLCYAIRRLIKYFSEIGVEDRSMKLMWKTCEPFSNPTVKRMLTVAHGTFCLLDVGDATARGFIAGAGTFNPAEFFLRLNIVGVGRFTISLYGEAKRGIINQRKESELIFVQRERKIVDNYIDGLKQLAAIYDDKHLVDFVDDFINQQDPVKAFQKSVELAEMRKVPSSESPKTKAEIDAYFARRDS
jgi:hypothetical protein